MPWLGLSWSFIPHSGHAEFGTEARVKSAQTFTFHLHFNEFS